MSKQNDAELIVKAKRMGAELRSEREARLLSSKEVGELADRSVSSILRIEKADADITPIKCIKNLERVIQIVRDYRDPIDTSEAAIEQRAEEITSLAKSCQIGVKPLGVKMGRSNSYAENAVYWKGYLANKGTAKGISKTQTTILEYLHNLKQKEDYAKAHDETKKENQAMEKATTSMGKTLELIAVKDEQKAEEREAQDADPVFRMGQVRKEIAIIEAEACNTRARIEELRKSEDDAPRISVMELVKHKRIRQRELSGQIADLEVVLAPLADLQKMEKDLSVLIKAAAFSELSDELRGLENKVNRMASTIAGDIGSALAALERLCG